MADDSIPLTVVISTTDDVDHIAAANLGNLMAQVEAVGGELMVATGGNASSDNVPAGVWVHHIPGGSVFDCRAEGLSLASGEIVAFTEDHCIQSDGWCERILRDFRERPDLVLLGGAVGNGSTRRIEDRMNFWMTFATFSPGQVTAMHPCIAQFIVRASAIARPLKPGELESSVILTFEMVPGAVFVDPELVVWHHQSHGFWNTFAAHFHNGRATGGLSPRRTGGRGLGVRDALRWTWRDAAAHVRRSREAFAAGATSPLVRAGRLLLIRPLILAHGVGAFIGYRHGPGTSAKQLA
jgi:hypothetical protein